MVVYADMSFQLSRRKMSERFHKIYIYCSNTKLMHRKEGRHNEDQVTQIGKLFEKKLRNM